MGGVRVRAKDLLGCQNSDIGLIRDPDSRPIYKQHKYSCKRLEDTILFINICPKSNYFRKIFVQNNYA